MSDDVIIVNPEDFENDGWTDDPEFAELLREIEEQDQRPSGYPEKRYYGEIDREVLLAEGKDEWGHPGKWKDPVEEVEPEEPEIPLCGKRLHQMTPENRTKFGACRTCWNVERRRTRAANNGNPLCWTGDHPEPEPGMICACGDIPPPDDFIDWALVENAVAGRELCRPMTNAEQVCALTTVAYRWEDVTGPYGARTWLRKYTDVRLSVAQVEYLFIKWLPANGGIARSAGEEFLRQMTEAAGQEESRPAA